MIRSGVCMRKFKLNPRRVRSSFYWSEIILNTRIFRSRFNGSKTHFNYRMVRFEVCMSKINLNSRRVRSSYYCSKISLNSRGFVLVCIVVK